MPGPIDPSVLENLRGYEADGVAFVDEVLGLFLTDTPAQLEAFRAAIAAGDVVVQRRIAHSLKGASWIVGATEFAETCAAIEDAAHRGHLADPAAALARMETAFARAREAFEVVQGR